MPGTKYYIFGNVPKNYDVVILSAAQLTGRFCKVSLADHITKHFGLKCLNLSIGGVSANYYNNEVFYEIINKSKIVLLNIFSGRSVKSKYYDCIGDCIYIDKKTNDKIYWYDAFKKMSKSLTLEELDAIIEEMNISWLNEYNILLDNIKIPVLFTCFNKIPNYNFSFNNEKKIINSGAFPQLVKNSCYKKLLKRIDYSIEYEASGINTLGNFVDKYYPTNENINDLFHLVKDKIYQIFIDNLSNNYLFSHFKLSQSYKYINELINSDNYKEFVLSKFNVDDSINENAELLIPKIIHQTGPDNYKENELSVKSIESFKSVYNDWEHKFWTDNDIEKFIKEEFEWFYDCWKNLPYPIMKFDAVRYCWLYKFGGMYTDIDTEPGIRNDKYLTGKEVILIINREKIFNENRFDELHVDNWWMCSSPNQEIWLDMIHYIKNYNHNYGKHFDILYRTGPYGLGLVVANYIMKNGDEKIKFLSRDKSNALLRESRTNIDKTYLIVHRSEGSWVKKI